MFWLSNMQDSLPYKNNSAVITILAMNFHVKQSSMDSRDGKTMLLLLHIFTQIAKYLGKFLPRVYLTHRNIWALPFRLNTLSFFLHIIFLAQN